MPNNYVLLDRIELNATAASVTFDNIPQAGYTDLKIVSSVRDSSSNNLCSMYFNGDTNSANYTNNYILGNGSSVSGGTNSSWLVAGIQEPSGNTANTFASGEFYVPNYTSSNQKSVSVDGVQENNATGAWAWLNASKWTGTAAITSVTLAGIGASFVSGSTFSLYGIAKLDTTPAIAPKADGGNVIGTDGTYWYHAFLSSGTFTPQANLTADAIVIGAGGGGGGDVGGGGGAGRVYGLSSLSMTSGTNYVCVVGGGGGGAGGTPPAITATPNAGLKGTDSSLIGGVISYSSLAGGGGQGRSNGTAAVNNGWSGGGQSYNSDRPATTGNGGYAGGSTSGVQTNPSYCGGGGGTTSAGTNSTNGGTSGGAGSSAYSSWATATGTGVSGAYAGGGGGGNYGIVGYRSYGQAGGGYGSYNDAASSAVANTGSGGGGAGSSQYAGNGGSGIVIIRYPVA